MPACQVCISQMAKVTDNDASLQNATQSNQDVKKIFSHGILIALFFPLETYQNDTHERRKR